MKIKLSTILISLLLSACELGTSSPPLSFPNSKTPTLITNTLLKDERVTGSIELANGLCCAGGQTGTMLEIPVAVSAESTEWPVQIMRLTYNYASEEIDIENAPWQPISQETTIPIKIVSNWVSFEACVQFRDKSGKLSVVYCDDISIEGIPTTPSPLNDLDYDLFWLTGTFSILDPPVKLMHFNYLIPEISCLVGNESYCDFVIEGSVNQYHFNENKSKLVINFTPTEEEDRFAKLAFLDLKSSEFKVFHELAENARLSEMALSPDNLWLAYREDDGRGTGFTTKIVSTLGNSSPVYELNCTPCISKIRWSYDGSYLSFGGLDDLWIVERNGEEWTGTNYFSDDAILEHSPQSWSPSANLLLARQLISTDLINFDHNIIILNPLNGAYIDLFPTNFGLDIRTQNWIDGQSVISFEVIASEASVQKVNGFLTTITEEQTEISADTQAFTMIFDFEGTQIFPVKINENQIAFGRITQKPDQGVWVETYVFDIFKNSLSLTNSCSYSPEHEPFLWQVDWSPDNELLFSDRRHAIIIPTDGRDCIELNDLLGSKIIDLTWSK